MKVFVPRDAAARSVGADEVAERILAAADAGGREIEVVRTGSRGMLWLEPLVEVETPEGRVGYGPVAPEDVDGLIAAGMLGDSTPDIAVVPVGGAAPDGDAGPGGGAAPPGDAGPGGGAAPGGGVRLGLVEELPWMKRQQRLTFARVGVIDPRSGDDHAEYQGNKGLQAALEMSPAEVVEEVVASGLRGRGGAGFPTGIKWRTVLGAESDLKFVCCNADEGDSGTFADRMLIEGDPFTLIEGMTIAAYAVGATEGYVYLRSEYPDAVETLNAAIRTARERGWLGQNILGSELTFDLHVRVGAGAYICGEETSMLESLEGKRGEVRAKPPIPALEGLFGRPTVVNNVLSLATIPTILANGAATYASYGMGRSLGTNVFQLGGNVARGGIVETAFGITLGELVNDLGGGTASRLPVRAVQVGGPLGAYLPVEQFDLPMDYEAFATAGAMVGHGGIVVFDETVDMSAMARFAFEFCAEESCGKCTPCRVGAVRGVETIDRIRRGEDRRQNLVLLDDLCDLMTDGSLCAMGGLTPLPVRSAVRHFGKDFGS